LDIKPCSILAFHKVVGSVSPSGPGSSGLRLRENIFMHAIKRFTSAAFTLALGFGIATGATAADDVASFYKGKRSK